METWWRFPFLFSVEPPVALSRRSCRSQKLFSFYLRCTLEAFVQDACRGTAAAVSHVSRGVNYTRSLCHPNLVGFLCNASAVRCANVISSAVNQSSSVNRKSWPCFVGKKNKKPLYNVFRHWLCNKFLVNAFSVPTISCNCFWKKQYHLWMFSQQRKSNVDLVKNQETVRRAHLGHGHNKVSQSQYYVFCW